MSNAIEAAVKEIERLYTHPKASELSHEITGLVCGVLEKLISTPSELMDVDIREGDKFAETSAYGAKTRFHVITITDVTYDRVDFSIDDRDGSNEGCGGCGINTARMRIYAGEWKRLPDASVAASAATGDLTEDRVREIIRDMMASWNRKNGGCE